MSKIRVLLADDHNIVREGLRHILESQKDLEVAGEAENGLETLDRVKELRPDVLLLDIAMPGLNGLEVVRLIKNLSPRTQMVVFSMHQKEAYVHEALSSGVLGYVLKSSPSSDVLAAIRAVQGGDFFLSSQIRTEVIQRYLENRDRQKPAKGYDLLSDREQQVFRLLVEGKSTKEISAFLHVSPKTVEKHRSNIMRKLDLHDLMGLVKYAVKIGVLDPELWTN